MSDLAKRLASMPTPRTDEFHNEWDSEYPINAIDFAERLERENALLREYLRAMTRAVREAYDIELEEAAGDLREAEDLLALLEAK